MIRARTGLVCALATAALWALPAATAVAGPGDLDPTFGGGDGKSVINLGASGGKVEIVLQSDGKILASTTLNPAGPDPGVGVARITTQGALDTSFGGGAGFSRLDYGSQDSAGSLLLQPDGKIDVIGTSTVGPSGTGFALARLLPQGTLDPSFAAGGTPGFLTSKYSTLSTSGAVDAGFGIALQSDSKIIVAGSSDLATPGAPDFAVARVLNPDGALDGGFGGGDGGETVDFDNHSLEAAFDVAVQPDDKIVLVGTSAKGNTVNMAAARFLPDGTPDNSFGSQGKVLLPGAEANSLAIQPNGKIVLVGDNRDIVSKSDIIVARLNANGTPDSSFDGDGRTAIDFGQEETGHGVALQPDGKIVVAGGSNQTVSDFAIARLQPNGQLDSTFAKNGEARVDIANDDGSSVALQKDGKIIVGGFSISAESIPNLALARLQGDPGAVKKAKCGGKKATIIGTNGKNKLKGTKKRDVIAALGGKDKVKGLKGNDLICGGKGRDRLLGGPGKDKLFGQAGKDKLFGQAGKDFLKGGPGKDKVKGGAGKDVEKP